MLRYSWRPPGCEERHRWLPAPEERARGTAENGSGSGSCRWMVSAESGSSQRTVMAGSHAYSFDDRWRVKGCQRANMHAQQISTRYSYSSHHVYTAFLAPSFPTPAASAAATSHRKSRIRNTDGFNWPEVNPPESSRFTLLSSAKLLAHSGSHSASNPNRSLQMLCFAA